jgi:hypothetical protein
VASSRLFMETTRPAVVAAVPRRALPPVALMLGMHRSGKSLCSNVLNAHVVETADRLEPNGSPSAENAPSHWERWGFAGLYGGIIECLDEKRSQPEPRFRVSGCPSGQILVSPYSQGDRRLSPDADKSMVATRSKILLSFGARPLWRQIALRLGPAKPLCFSYTLFFPGPPRC